MSSQICRFQWPRSLRRGCAAARLLGLWFRIPPGHGCLSIVNVVYCQIELSASDYIIRPEESYRMWFVWVWWWSLDNEEALAYRGLLRNGGGEKILKPLFSKAINPISNSLSEPNTHSAPYLFLWVRFRILGVYDPKENCSRFTSVYENLCFKPRFFKLFFH
jgi:hypothetical protein